MKRLAVMAMALVMIVCALALPASAVTANGLYGNVPLYKGTINVDGKMDEIYKQGLKIEAVDYSEKYASDSRADVYLLHDGKNLYVLIDAKSGYPISDYNPKYDGAASWNTTCIEFFLDWSDAAAKAADGYKYYARLDGGLFGGYKAADKPESQTTYKVTVDKATGKFVMEFQFPMRDGAATGKNIGINMMFDSDKTMGKDKNATRSIRGILPGVGNDAQKFKSVTLSNTEVKLAAATTAATTKAPATKPTAPATFDAGIVLAVVAAAAGAGVVVSKKRK
ncbi:MAG: hypothetical protein E7662_02205 [Ruminococcaceae bacterium]|nr:hypothetical protein [Oscillospiraceae bacterium]